jgi:hypothetical protein
MNIETGHGPIYGVELIDNLNLGTGSMRQAMPSRLDLQEVAKISTRTVAGYEVLLSHYRDQQQRIAKLEAALRETSEFAAAHHSGQESCIWLHSLTIDIPHRIADELGRK